MNSQSVCPSYLTDCSSRISSTLCPCRIGFTVNISTPFAFISLLHWHVLAGLFLVCAVCDKKKMPLSINCAVCSWGLPWDFRAFATWTDRYQCSPVSPGDKVASHTLQSGRVSNMECLFCVVHLHGKLF